MHLYSHYIRLALKIVVYIGYLPRLAKVQTSDDKALQLRHGQLCGVLYLDSRLMLWHITTRDVRTLS